MQVTLIFAPERQQLVRPIQVRAKPHVFRIQPWGVVGLLPLLKIVEYTVGWTSQRAKINLDALLTNRPALAPQINHRANPKTTLTGARARGILALDLAMNQVVMGKLAALPQQVTAPA